MNAVIVFKIPAKFPAGVKLARNYLIIIKGFHFLNNYITFLIQLSTNEYKRMP